jgi:hypothetical protein
MEEDLRRCFVARVGTSKRSGGDEGDLTEARGLSVARWKIHQDPCPRVARGWNPLKGKR